MASVGESFLGVVIVWCGFWCADLKNAEADDAVDGEVEYDE